MYVDSDDFIAKNTLEGLFSFAENHDADVVIFDYIRGTTDIKNVQRQHYKIITDKYDGIPFNIETAESFVYRYVPVGVCRSGFSLTINNFPKTTLKISCYYWKVADRCESVVCRLGILEVVGCGFNRTIYILVHQTMHPTRLR